MAIALGALSLIRELVLGRSLLGLFWVLAFVGWWCFLLYFASWGRAWALAGIVLLAALELLLFGTGWVVSARSGAGLWELLAQGLLLGADVAILGLGLRVLGQARRVAGAAAGMALLLGAWGVAAEAAAAGMTYDVHPLPAAGDVGALHLGDPTRTVAALEREVAQDPQAAEPLLELARIFVERAGEIEEIQAVPYYHRNTGELAGRIRGEDPLQQAAGYLERASRLRPECPPCELLRARLVLARGRSAEARERLQRWTLRHGESAEAFALLALALEAAGDRFGAEGLARKAATLDSSQAAAHLLLGRVLLERGRPAEAGQAFERAAQAAAPWQRGVRVEAAVGRGRALGAEAQVPRAEEVLREALRQSPDQPALYDELAWILARAGRYADAVQVSLDRLRWRRYDPDAYLRLYEVFELHGDWQGAERLLASLVARDEEDATAHYYLGLVRRHLRKVEPSRQAFQRALDLSGEGSQVHRLARRQLAR